MKGLHLPMLDTVDATDIIRLKSIASHYNAEVDNDIENS